MRYFAYGATLDPAQALPVTGGQAAVLDDWELSLSVPSTEWGGAVGTIEPRPGSVVYGVLFHVPDELDDDIRVREGMSRGHTREFPVEARIYVGADSAQATLRLELASAFAAVPARVSITPPAPSARWLAAVVAGGRAHGLPEDWLRQLERRQP